MFKCFLLLIFYLIHSYYVTNANVLVRENKLERGRRDKKLVEKEREEGGSEREN